MEEKKKSYPWEADFDALASKGMDRMVQALKLLLREVPRLKADFLSTETERKFNSRQEIMVLFMRLDQEMSRCRTESGLSPDEFSQSLNQQARFTPEEQQTLASLPQLLKLYGIELFQRNPPPRGKQPRMKG